MKEYTIVFEFINGNRKVIDVDHDTFLVFNKLTQENATWFNYGRDRINLNNVCICSYNIIDDDKQKEVIEEPSNDAKAYFEW